MASGADSYDTVKSYRAEIVSATDYYPGGMPLVGRNFYLSNDSSYRYGYNKGSEKDDDIEGKGDEYTTEFRELDARLGPRWWSVDPKPNAYESPYLAMADNPISNSDVNGDVADGGKNPLTDPSFRGCLINDDNTANVGDEKGGASPVQSPAAQNKGTANNSSTTPVKNSSSTEPVNTKTGTTPPAPAQIGSVNASSPSQKSDQAPAQSSTQTPNTQQDNGYAINPWAIALAVSGTRFTFLKPVGYLGSEAGSSIVSTVLSKALPYRSPLIKATSEQVLSLFGESGSAVLGRAIGRAVPIVGEVWIAYDIGTYVAPKMAKGLSEYQQDYQNSDIVYHICFKQGTLVYAKNGLVTIESIKVGDSVYTYNLQKNRVELSKVLNTFERNTGEIYRIATSDQEIDVTAEHPFYVDGKGWVTVKDLKVGDKFKTEDSTLEEVKSLKSMKQTLTVYNIEVDGNHDYFVTSSKILVHNKHIKPLKELEAFEKKMKLETQRQLLKQKSQKK